MAVWERGSSRIPNSSSFLHWSRRSCLVSDQLISTDLDNFSTFTSSKYKVQPEWLCTISQDLTQLQKSWTLSRYVYTCSGNIWKQMTFLGSRAISLQS